MTSAKPNGVPLGLFKTNQIKKIMKLQIDTTAKTIKVEGAVNLKELMDAVKKFFPDEQWKDYSLEGSTVWTYIPPYTWSYTTPYYPKITTTALYALATP